MQFNALRATPPNALISTAAIAAAAAAAATTAAIADAVTSRVHLQVDDAMELTKEQYRARMERCALRQRDLEAKQGEMRGQVARFEKFIQENDAKRARAE